MKNSNIDIIVVKSYSSKDKNLAAFQWQFLVNSLGPSDIKTIEKMGIETYAEMECIDERAAAQTILTGKIRYEGNYPGGGFDFLTPKDLRKILIESNGRVVLDPHRCCGWGGIRFKEYLNYDKPITRPIKCTTMHIPVGHEFVDGIDYIWETVKNALEDDNFINSIMRSMKIQWLYGSKRKIYEKLKLSFPKPGVYIEPEENCKEIILLAFVFGKMQELKKLFEIEAINLQMQDAFISLNPDMLFEQPHNHLAEDAVINLGERKLIKRFPINSTIPESFFVDTKLENFNSIFKLINGIMETSLSNKISVKQHIFHIVCDKKMLPNIQKEVTKLKSQVNIIKTATVFYIHLIENNENPKTEDEILDIVL